MKETIKIPLALAIVCLVSALLLSLTYDLTRPIIDDTDQNLLQDQLSGIIKAESYSKLSDENAELFGKLTSASSSPPQPDPAQSASAGVGSLIKEVYLAKSSNSIAGSIFLLSKPGYSGDIKFLVGFQANKITQVSIFTQTETPGLGTRIEEEGFLSQFSNQPFTKKDYDTITGATISSLAVIDTLTETIQFIVADLSTDEKRKLGLSP